jgi:hypothetical protein
MTPARSVKPSAFIASAFRRRWRGLREGSRRCVQGLPSAQDGRFRIFEIASGSNVIISGLMIAKGSGDSGVDGGGIYNAGIVTITNSTKSGNPWEASQFLHTAGTLP